MSRGKKASPARSRRKQKRDGQRDAVPKVETLPAIPDHFSALARAAEMSPTHLRFRSRVGYQQWASFGALLGRMQSASLWWVGDWIRFGEHAFGERYAQALEVTGLALRSLQNAVWVAERFEISRRREVLPFSFHADVAALEEPEQERLLDAAEKNGWSRSLLRDAIRVFKCELARGNGMQIAADPKRLAHVGREYQRQLDEIRSRSAR
jgi:hypothetical protein